MYQAFPLDDPAAEYASLDDEMISRMPIILAAARADSEILETSPMRNFEPNFKHDNGLVCEYLRNVLGTSVWWVHAKGLQKANNGRQAFRGIHSHIFGKAAMNSRHVINRADIEALHYHGEKNKQNFSTSVARHKECHVIQASLADDTALNDFTELEKVTFLLNGIKVSDVDAVIVTIQASPNMMETFAESCVAISDFIRIKATSRNRTRGIAALTTHNRGGGGGCGNGGGGS